MYSLLGENVQKNDIHILSKFDRPGSWKDECPDVLEVWDWFSQQDSIL